VFGIALWFSIPFLLPGEPGFQIDTRLFPRAIAVLLFVTGLASAVASWVGFGGKRQESESVEETGKQGAAKNFRVAVMVFIMFSYAFLIEPLGFLPASFVIVTAILILQKIRKVHFYIIVYAASYVIYCIFHYLLMVQLP
jgi:hypothetical protein